MTKFFVKKPYFVLVTVIIVLVVGFVSLGEMQTDLLPELELPYMAVITTEVGASPEKVENDVIKPMESTLGTISGVEKLTSTSANNYGMLMLEFAEDTNMEAALVRVSKALNSLSLPEGCGTPNIMEISADMMATMYASVSYEGKDIKELSNFAEKTIAHVDLSFFVFDDFARQFLAVRARDSDPRDFSGLSSLDAYAHIPAGIARAVALPVDLLDEHILFPADSRLQRLLFQLAPQRNQLAGAFLADVPRHAVRHERGLRALALGIREDVHPREPRARAGVLRLREFRLRFAGEAGHHIGGQRAILKRFAQHGAGVQKFAAGVAPVHAREHRVAAALQREVELMADLRHALDPLDEFRRDDDRLQRAQPHPRDSRHVVRRANRIEQRRAVLRVAAVAGQVDARQHNLRASAAISSTGRERIGPRTDGMMQYVHQRSQPS